MRNKMSSKRPIKKKHDGWTLLDRAYELIKGEFFDDLDTLFSHHDVKEIDANLEEFTLEDLAETGSDLEIIAYCLELAREQGLKRFENYFKDIKRFRELSDIIADKIDERLYGGKE